MGKGIVASNLDQIGEVLEHGRTALARPARRRRRARRRPARLDRRSGAARASRRGGAARGGRARYTWREHTRRTIARLQEIVDVNAAWPAGSGTRVKRLLAVSWEMPPMYGPRATQVSRTLRRAGCRSAGSRRSSAWPRGAADRTGRTAPTSNRRAASSSLRVPSPEEWLIVRAPWRAAAGASRLSRTRSGSGSAARHARPSARRPRREFDGLVTLRAAVVRSSRRPARASRDRPAVGRALQRSRGSTARTATPHQRASLAADGGGRRPRGRGRRVRDQRDGRSRDGASIPTSGGARPPSCRTGSSRTSVTPLHRARRIGPADAARLHRPLLRGHPDADRAAAGARAAACRRNRSTARWN